MWLKRLTSMFITVAVAAMLVSGQDPVTLGKNNPGPVRIPLGSPLSLKCNLSTPETDRFWVSWHHNPSRPSFNGAQKIDEWKVEGKLKHDKEDMDETLMLNVTPNDTKDGWYFCSVRRDIPRLLVETSNGTEVVILPMPPTDGCPLMDCQHWAIVGVSAFIPIIFLAGFFLLRKRCRRSRVEDPVYANTRPVAKKQPSPRPGMQVQSLKTASSSQNLRQHPSPGARYEDGKRRYKR